MNGKALGPMTIRALLLGEIVFALGLLRRPQSTGIISMNYGKVKGLISAAGCLAAISADESNRLSHLASNAAMQARDEFSRIERASRHAA